MSNWEISVLGVPDVPTGSSNALFFPGDAVRYYLIDSKLIVERILP